MGSNILDRWNVALTVSLPFTMEGHTNETLPKLLPLHDV